MPSLEALYQQTIIDHNKSPRNYGELPEKTHYAQGYNPLCGDQMHVELILKDGVVEDIKFSGQGCAISKASSSLMTTLIKGKTKEEALKDFERFHTLVTSDPESMIDEEQLGKLTTFAGVRQFPSRIKCATLGWHTLKAALTNEEHISTE